MLSSVQVSQFLQNTIGFKDWETVLFLDKLEFLNKFLRHFIKNIYFQNVTMTSIAAEDRRAPSDISEIIERGLSGKGGVCIDLNYFANLILTSLGFNCICVQGTYTTSSIIGNHCATIVELSSEEKYLVDVGNILPGLKLIPMHNLPFSFVGGGLIHEWRHCDDGVYRRYQIGGKLFTVNNDDKPNKTEETRVEIYPETKTLDDFKDPMNDVFTNMDRSFLLNTPFLFRYLDDLDDENSTFVYIWGTKLLTGDKNSRKVTKFANLKELGNVIEKYFPKLDKLELQNSMKHFEDVYRSSPQAF